MKDVPAWKTPLICVAIALFASSASAEINNSKVSADKHEYPAQIVAAALARTEHHVIYDGSYVRLDYPNGDVPSDRGVCTDVVIRTLRALNIDLQQRVHEDMRANFADYPSKRIWGLSRPDKNIDHRRVPNLQTYFSRHGVTLPITSDATHYLPGDIVTWMLPGNLPHIGIVVSAATNAETSPDIVHNIGRGPEREAMLFDYPITGHYRYPN
ncbi:DUF1287 domain-containing protein [Thaumasiovibrio subtropicus]|uniref:DUF1287 domain-containing protein n=1 Tax=Thaumasiovibrio subtropicus TaxID=1891207 RepID=UPI000B361F81|nr:DUF1287 domain-containing protein [Thaumasiovibrio subtropicus]